MKRFTLLFLFGASAFATDVQGLIITPTPYWILNSADGTTGFAIDAAGEYAAAAFQVREAATLTSLCFNYFQRTGTPVQHKISLQSVGTDGNPSGTISASAAFTPPADATWDGTFRCVAISHDGAGGVLTSLAVTRGQLIAVKVENCPNATAPCAGATTPDVSNFSTFSVGFTVQGGRPGIPYAITAPGGTPARAAVVPVFGVRSASKTYGIPIQSIIGTAISSGDEQGVRFTIPSGLCTTYKLAGVRATVTPGAAAKSVKVSSYSGSTVQATASYDTDATGGTDGGRLLEWLFQDATLPTFNGGTQYRVGFAPQDVTTNFALRRLILAVAGDQSAFPGGTIVGGYSTRTGCTGACDEGDTGVAWTDTDTARPLVELVIDDCTNTAGVSGGSFTFVQ